MRRSLVLLSAATTTSVVVALLFALGVGLRERAEEQVMVMVSLQAQNAVTLLATEGGDAARLSTLNAIERSEPGVRALLVLPDDRVLSGEVAGTRGDVPSPPLVASAREQGQTLAGSQEGDRVLAAPYFVDGDVPYVLQLSVGPDRLYDGLLWGYLVLGALGVMLVLLAGLAFARLGAWFLRPVRELATVSRELAAGDLERRAVPGGPVEMVDVAAGLNSLAERISELLSAERERTAELAHRLRTPLTALQLGVEQVPDELERARLSALLANLGHEVDAVITLSREPRSQGRRVVDARAVVAERVDFWAALAHEENRDIGLVLPEGEVWVPLAAADLADAVDVLLDNVLTHTPEGTDLHVSLTAAVDAEDLVRLNVADEGPGIPSPETALERGVSGAGSTGLGLSIVHRTVTAAGGEVELGRRPGGGTLVRLRLPAVASPELEAPID